VEFEGEFWNIGEAEAGEIGTEVQGGAETKMTALGVGQRIL
jgi:hypothetical protein